MNDDLGSLTDAKGEGHFSGSPLELKLNQLRLLHGDKDAVELLRVMIQDEFPGKIAVVSSFGAESAVLLSLVAKISKETPVIFLETGKHFPETLIYRERLVSHLGLSNVRDEKPRRSEIEEDDPEGELWHLNTDYCCHLRKVLPLERSLEPFEAWITGRKRFQSNSREDLESIELNGNHIKINPLSEWDAHQLKEYQHLHLAYEHRLLLELQHQK